MTAAIETPSTRAHEGDRERRNLAATFVYAAAPKPY